MENPNRRDRYLKGYKINQSGVMVGITGVHLVNVRAHLEPGQDRGNVPVTHIAKNHGFRCPVYFTHRVIEALYKEFCLKTRHQNRPYPGTKELVLVDELEHVLSIPNRKTPGTHGAPTKTDTAVELFKELVRDVLVAGRAAAVTMKHQNVPFGSFVYPAARQKTNDIPGPVPAPATATTPNMEKSMHLGGTNHQLFIVFNPISGFTIMLPSEF